MMGSSFFRIGEKLINIHKIDDKVREILKLRAHGYSQGETSKKADVDRTFISRLERLGEVKKGSKVAVIGFPIKNKDELNELCAQYNVEHIMLMTEKERWDWVRNSSGEKLINRIMEMVHELQEYDIIIVLGSSYRINLIKAFLRKEVIGLEIGNSPIQEDVYLKPGKLQQILEEVTLQDDTKEE